MLHVNCFLNQAAGLSCTSSDTSMDLVLIEVYDRDENYSLIGDENSSKMALLPLLSNLVFCILKKLSR